MSSNSYSAPLLAVIMVLTLIATTYGKETSSISGPQDWTSSDRIEWHQASGGMEASQLKEFVQNHKANTFLVAAKHNIQNLRSYEYLSIGERNDFYSFVSYLIEFDSVSPKAITGVRFFHAADAVTRGGRGIAAIEAPLGQCFSKESRKFLIDINKTLFDKNLPLINGLFFKWKTTRNPLDQNKDIEDFDFDLKMVEFEQSAVESFITSHKPSNNTMSEVSSAMNGAWIGQCPIPLPNDPWIVWAKEAVGSALAFQNKKHRVAVGKAAVFVFHKKAKVDYLAYITQ